MENNKPWKRILLTCLILIILGIVTQLLSSYILELILNLLPDTREQYDNLLTSLTRPTPLRILYVGLLAPVIEELIFRYGIMGVTSKWLPFAIANLIQAALFGLYHMQLVQSVYAFLLGLVIGYVVKKCGGVRYGILYHAAINVTGLMMVYYSAVF